MTAGLDEDMVDFVPNYDSSTTQPEVLPAAMPNLLVNGAAGIAVGMATNMPPHNLGEVVAAARHLLDHPEAGTEELMRYVPGPDLPSGGVIIGLDGIREAYTTGRGTFRTRAVAKIEPITARRQGIIVTELPYQVGPERVIDKIKDQVQSRRLQGISAVTDLTDRNHGLKLQIEVKTGFNPEAVLAKLYQATPMEEGFSINNVALVDGQPRTLGLRELLQVYLAHRVTVVRRRTAHRLARRQERAHLVEGLLVAVLNIDEVIQVIRTSDEVSQARQRLMGVFDLSEAQAEYILELRLRRLTKFSRLELEAEADQLAQEIAELQAILADEARLRAVVGQELAAVAAEHGTPRRTVLLDSAGVEAEAEHGPAATTRPAPLEVADTPCWVMLGSTGLLARLDDAERPARDGDRVAYDALTSLIPATTRGQVLAVTSRGRGVVVHCLEVPALPPTAAPPSLAGGAPVAEFVELAPGETVVGLARLDAAAPPLTLGTAGGVVKRVAGEYPAKDEFEVIGLREDDRVVGLGHADDAAWCCFMTSDAQLLRFQGEAVRPQGRPAGGMAGIKLAPGAKVEFFGVVDDPHQAVVVTVAGSSNALPGLEAGSGKVTPFELYPPKGRATGGVRCQRFLKGQDTLLHAWAGTAPARAIAADGRPVRLPDLDQRRDGSGTLLSHRAAAIG
jgi:DNA gyrase subunit A